MGSFVWHLMADEMPEKGKKNFIVMGLKGGVYLAPRFEGYGNDGNDVWFRDTRGNLHYPGKVLAWAEIPPLDATPQWAQDGVLHIVCEEVPKEIHVSRPDSRGGNRVRSARVWKFLPEHDENAEG